MKSGKATAAARRRATAFHEAGHAVADVALGLTVNSVSIIPCEEYNGVCRSPPVLGYHFSNKREQRAIARDVIISLYAGMPAERLIDPDAPASHGEEDEADALELSRKYAVLPRSSRFVGDERHMAYLERLRGEARRLVRKHRAAVAKLAEVLLNRKELDSSEVEAIAGPLLNE